ncbi:hypothetical protein C0585_00345 [Candidatus Woesearchaeota archaeon]|nr:MAG: hypothetical protein C0585_00345 [Candidatus Woesearchaeota archaeon]
MRILKSKKGGGEELIYLTLFTLLFLILLTFFLFQYADSWKDSTFLERTYLAKDIGLLSEALQLVPGDVKVTYPKELIDMQIEMNKEEISIENIKSGGFVDLAKFTPLFTKKTTINNIIYPETPEDIRYVVELSKIGTNIVPSTVKVAGSTSASTSTTATTSSTSTSSIDSVISSLKEPNENWEDEKIITDYFETSIRIPDSLSDTGTTTLKSICTQILSYNTHFLSRKDCGYSNKIDTTSKALLEIYLEFDSSSSKIKIYTSSKTQNLAEIIKILAEDKNLEGIEKSIQESTGKFDSKMTISIGYDSKSKEEIDNIRKTLGQIIPKALTEYYEP